MPKTSPQGDVGAAILTKPWAALVPGSIAGAGLPGLGERWSSWLVATAAESRLIAISRALHGVGWLMPL